MAEFLLLPKAKIAALILPSENDVARYAAPKPAEDDFFTYNAKGFPCVRNPVGISEVTHGSVEMQ